jgi:hypothetical protein
VRVCVSSRGLVCDFIEVLNRELKRLLWKELFDFVLDSINIVSAIRKIFDLHRQLDHEVM